jgi:hypothetical protein
MLARATSTMVEETDTSSIDGGGCGRRSRERWSRERESDRDLESFEMKRETTRGGLIFIGSKISEAVLNQNRC